MAYKLAAAFWTLLGVFTTYGLLGTVLQSRECHADAAIQCPNVVLKSPFELSQFLGVWYEIARLSNSSPTSRPLTRRPFLSSCVRLNLSTDKDGNVTVERSGLDESEQLVVQIGVASSDDLAQHANLYFTYPGLYEEALGVVEVDYEEYALLYGCHLTSAGHLSTNAWILSRERSIDDSTLEILKGHLVGQHIDVSQMKLTRQDELCQKQNPDNNTLIPLPPNIGV